jgi:hypothetical protein
VLEADIDKPTKNLPATANKNIPLEDIIHYVKRGNTDKEIAALLGCSAENIRVRRKEANLESLARFSQHKPDVLEAKQRDLINALDGPRIEKMSAYQIVGSTSLLNEMIRNERGQIGQIVSHVNIIADLRESRQRLVDAGIIIDVEHEQE